jgi:6-phosphofructokinase 1
MFFITNREQTFSTLPMNPFTIEKIGEATYTSQLAINYTQEQEVVLYDPVVKKNGDDNMIIPKAPFAYFEKAGAREKLFFNPSETIAGIVVCGGLCPGINNVIKALVQTLHYRYQAKKVYGFKYGFEGLTPEAAKDPIELTTNHVRDIHQFGGSYLGTSRGPQSVSVMVDTLERLQVSTMFVIGGDGSQRGALALVEEIKKRDLKIAVIGVPKTVDNDLLYVEKTFGFETAVEMAQHPIRAAHEEARAHRNGVGIVKLMGRDSGFIALHASVASSDVNVLLLPEKHFDMEKLVDYLQIRFKSRDHCVIVVAEGAGQDPKNTEKDKSGNVKLNDVGVWLRESISKELKARKVEHTIKYIDPSYTIRTAPTNSYDSIFCFTLAQMAVHAAMSGKTSMIVGFVQGEFVHIPISKAIEKRKIVDCRGILYQTFLDGSGMPNLE